MIRRGLNRYSRGIVLNQIRNVGVHSRVLNSDSANSHDISEELSNSNLPQGTGRGPFIELPHFKPLGVPSNLLNITLPQSSNLSIRNGSIIAVNGELNQMTSEHKLLSAKTGYEEITTHGAVSLIVNGVTSHRNYDIENYSIIKIEDNKESWTILNDDSLIAWSGYNMKLSPTRWLDKFNSFKTEGKGIIVVNGSNQLYDITLAENETLLLNPNSLIASTMSTFETEILRRNTKFLEILPISLQKLLIGFWSGLKTPFTKMGLPQLISTNFNKLRVSFDDKFEKLVDDWSFKSTLSTGAKYMHRFLHSIRLSLFALFARKPIFFKFKGPGKLLVNNDRVVANERIFSKQEIEDIYRTNRD